MPLYLRPPTVLFTSGLLYLKFRNQTAFSGPRHSIRHLKSFLRLLLRIFSLVSSYSPSSSTHFVANRQTPFQISVAANNENVCIGPHFFFCMSQQRGNAKCFIELLKPEKLVSRNSTKLIDRFPHVHSLYPVALPLY